MEEPDAPNVGEEYTQTDFNRTVIVRGISSLPLNEWDGDSRMRSIVIYQVKGARGFLVCSLDDWYETVEVMVEKPRFVRVEPAPHAD